MIRLSLSLSIPIKVLPPPRGKLVVSARIYQRKVSRLPLTGSLSFFLSLRWKSVGNKGVRIGASLNWENVLGRERENESVGSRCVSRCAVSVSRPRQNGSKVWLECGKKVRG